MQSVTKWRTTKTPRHTYIPRIGNYSRILFLFGLVHSVKRCMPFRFNFWSINITSSHHARKLRIKGYGSLCEKNIISDCPFTFTKRRIILHESIEGKIRPDTPGNTSISVNEIRAGIFLNEFSSSYRPWRHLVHHENALLFEQNAFLSDSIDLKRVWVVVFLTEFFTFWKHFCYLKNLTS